MFAFIRNLIRRQRAKRDEHRREAARQFFEKTYGQLAFNDDGVRLHFQDAEVWSFRWDDVAAIRTYKRDLTIYDMICLTFTLAGGREIEVWEECRGFADFMTEVRRRFPEIPEDWYLTVMTPVFKRCERKLWQRPAREL